MCLRRESGKHRKNLAQPGCRPSADRSDSPRDLRWRRGAKWFRNSRTINSTSPSSCHAPQPEFFPVAGFPFRHSSNVTMAGICDTCHAGCCRTYNVFITAHDALTIAQDLALPVAEFVTFLAADEQQARQFPADHQSPMIFSDPGKENARFFLMLKKVESGLIPGTLKCFFLQEWKRQDPIANRGDHPGARIAGRCGVYGSRPLLCRTFPSTLHENGAVGFISTPQPTEVEKTNEIYKLCPEKWTPQAFSSDPTKVLHTLVLSRYETDFQNRAVAEWNAKPGLMKDFFPYMLAAYGNRFRLAPELVATPPSLQDADNPAPIPE